MKNTPFRHKTAEESPGFLLYRVTSLWQQKLSSIFTRFDLYQTQYAILASLLYFEERSEISSQSDLAAHARIEKMTLSKAIRQLEKRGLVLRTASVEDSRVNVVRLTGQGRSLIRKAIIAVETADEEFFSALKQQELDAYRSLSVKIIHSNPMDGK